jgi:hypothetical protein
MRIFLSWSGERSKRIAEALRNWLPDVISYFEPWVSSEDIETGARWGEEISQQLENTHTGIICLTPESISAPWILFEAGALAKALNRARVCTYLFEIQPTELEGPLVQFQFAQASKADTLKLLRTLNGRLEAHQLPADRLERVFEHWWPKLDHALKEIPIGERLPAVLRTDHDLLEELLDLVRQLSKHRGAVKPSQHIDRIPFDNLFFDADVDKFGDKTELKVAPNDPNAQEWAPKDLLSQERRSHRLDGLWASRWFEEGFDRIWQAGTADIMSHGNFVVILHTDPKYSYIMLARWVDERTLIGRNYNLKDISDTSPWKAVVVNERRIDGAWIQGRWDLRRPESMSAD